MRAATPLRRSRSPSGVPATLAVAAVGFWCPLGSIAQEPGSGDDAPGPAAVARAIIAADNARDLAAVMELYAPDAELWPPGEPPVRGALAIEGRYSRLFASVRPNLRTTIHRVREAPGWALVEGEVHGVVTPISGGDPRTVADKYLMVLERSRQGVWRITRLMWSSDRAQPGEGLARAASDCETEGVTSMSVTHLHDWRFRRDGDVEAGIAAMRDYVQDLVGGESGLELSPWLRDTDDPLRFFHVAVYESREALNASSVSDVTERFVDRLYPEIDRSSHVITTPTTLFREAAGSRELS